MPRVVIMSDIHGNLAALRAVLATLPPHDQLFVAGDLCLEGPQPAAVFDLLTELRCSMVMGNTDRDIIHPPRDRETRKARQVEWARHQLGDERLLRMAHLPFSCRYDEPGAERVLVVHANPLTMDRHLYPTMSEEELEPYLKLVDTPILAFGHLHTPYVRPVAGKLLIDVSSVGHPKDRDLRAAYTVLSWQDGQRSLQQVRVPYDVEETVDSLRRSGMPGAEEEVEALLKASYE